MSIGTIRKPSRPKKYKCEIENCGKCYSRPCLLEQHIRTHSNDRPFVCDQCGKSFFRDSHLSVHLWTHSTDKPLKCKVCSKGFVTSQQLSRHLKTHPSEFKCPYECDKSFLTNQELSDHMLSEHVMNDIVDIVSHQNKTESLIKDLQFQLDYPDLPNIPDFKIYKCSSSNTFIEPSFGETIPESNPSSIDESTQVHDNNQDNNYWSIWNDHHCKEPNCQGYPSYDTYQDLIFHYDEFHQFVPKSLFQALDLDDDFQDLSFSAGLNEDLPN